MVCYVDAVRSYPTAGLRFGEYCHLLADQLGMPRRFFQEHPWRWHYDLPEHLRTDAVRLGAREVSMHEVGALLRARRARLRADA